MGKYTGTMTRTENQTMGNLKCLCTCHAHFEDRLAQSCDQSRDFQHKICEVIRAHPQQVT
jgi:hypothetical protein